MSPLPALNTALLGGSEFSPFLLPVAPLASLARTVRGRRCERGAWSLTKLQGACSCVCTTLCMLELEGKQRFPLKAVTGLSESHFHRLHGYQHIFFFFFFACQVPAALPLFILLIAARGRKEIISLIPLSSFKMMHLQWMFYGSLLLPLGRFRDRRADGSFGDPFPQSSPGWASSRTVSLRGHKTENLQETNLPSFQDTSSWALSGQPISSW